MTFLSRPHTSQPATLLTAQPSGSQVQYPPLKVAAPAAKAAGVCPPNTVAVCPAAFAVSAAVQRAVRSAGAGAGGIVTPAEVAALLARLVEEEARTAAWLQLGFPKTCCSLT